MHFSALKLFVSLSLAAILFLTVPAQSAEIRGTQSTPALLRVPITLKINVDLSEQKLTVLENGALKYTWTISTGKSSAFPTPVGTFTPQWMTPMWYSRQWSWTPMPYAIFINEGVAIHATSEISKLGQPASKGCIRLSLANAKTLFKMVSRHGMKATRVSIIGQPIYSQKRTPADISSSAFSAPNSYPQKSSARSNANGSDKTPFQVKYMNRYPKGLELSKSRDGSISVYGGF